MIEDTEVDVFEEQQQENGATDCRDFTLLSNGMAHCEILHPVYGWLPFTVDPDDKEKSTLDVLAYMEANKISLSELPEHPSVALVAAEYAREWRDEELKSVDVTINKIEDFEIEGDSKVWRQYRVALRNWPESEDFPTTKPTPPKA